MVPNGLQFPEHVNFGGWGGRFDAKRQKNVRSGTGNNTVDGLLDRHSEYFLFSDTADRWSWRDKNYDNVYATVFRWREAFQNDFAARMDRCVRPFNEVNHAPRAVVNGDASLALISADAKAGEVLKFHAEASTDPDGDALSHHWWHYPEPGSYRGDVVIDGAATPNPSIRVPPDAARKNFHLILEITDDGSPPLRAYRRVLVTVE
jgi:hypothetical protein